MGGLYNPNRTTYIYMDTLKTKLQVNPSAVDRCAAQLTRHAVHYVEKLYLDCFASMG